MLSYKEVIEMKFILTEDEKKRVLEKRQKKTIEKQKSFKEKAKRRRKDV